MSGYFKTFVSFISQHFIFCDIVHDSLKFQFPIALLWVCCCSVTKSCLTFCDPMDCNIPGFPVLHYLLEFSQTIIHWVSNAIQPSHPLLPPCIEIQLASICSSHNLPFLFFTSHTFLVESIGFSTQTPMSSRIKFCIFFFNLNVCYFFFFLIALIRTPKTRLVNQKWWEWVFLHFSLSFTSKYISYRFFTDVLYQNEEVPSYSWEFFKGWLMNSIKCFHYIYLDEHIIFCVEF